MELTSEQTLKIKPRFITIIEILSFVLAKIIECLARAHWPHQLHTRPIFRQGNGESHA